MRRTALRAKLKTIHNPLSKLLWPLIILALLLIVDSFLIHDFSRIYMRNGRLYGSMIDILHRGTPVMLLAIGMTLVIATAGVDLSVGAIIAISGAIAAALLVKDVPVIFVILASLGVSYVAGAWNGILVAYIGVQPIVATLILMVAGRGIAQLISNGQIITFENPRFEFIANGSFAKLPFTITIVVIALAATYVMTRKTALGLFIEAVGNNERGSFYSGINARVVKTLVYAFCGLCAGVAGLIIASDIKAADSNNAGLWLELDAILSVVIGGTSLTGGRFNLAGSIVGALIIQTLTTTILSAGVPVEYTLVVKAIVVLAVCLLQSEQFRKATFGRFARSGGRG